jgi:hypothetical protein
MSPEIDFTHKLIELNTFYLPVKNVFRDFDSDHLSKVSFIHSSNDLLNRIHAASFLDGFDIDTNLFDSRYQNQLALIQSIQDIHNHTKKVKRAFRKAALEIATDNQLSDHDLGSLTALITTLCLLLQHLEIYQQDKVILGERS